MLFRLLIWAVILVLVVSAIGLAFRVAWGALSLVVVAAAIWWIWKKGWLGIGGR